MEKNSKKQKGFLDYAVPAVIYGIIALVILSPTLAGIWVGGKMIEANKHACQAIEALGGQIGGTQSRDGVSGPQFKTAEECVAAVEAGSFMFYISPIFIANVAGIMFGIPVLLILVKLFGGKKKQSLESTEAE